MVMLTTKEAAEQLSITVHGVIKAIQRGQITATKYGGQRGIWLICSTEVDRYQNERRGPGRPPENKSNSLDK